MEKEEALACVAGILNQKSLNLKLLKFYTFQCLQSNLVLGI